MGSVQVSRPKRPPEGQDGGVFRVILTPGGVTEPWANLQEGFKVKAAGVITASGTPDPLKCSLLPLAGHFSEE